MTTRSANEDGRAVHPATVTITPQADSNRSRCRIRRRRVSAHVRVSGELARRVLLDVVPPSGRYREARNGEYIVFLSHIDQLAAAMRTAGVFLDDREVAR